MQEMHSHSIILANIEQTWKCSNKRLDYFSAISLKATEALTYVLLTNKLALKQRKHKH